MGMMKAPLLDPPAIKIAVQRLECSGCGSETNATCSCGKAYMPKAAERVAKAAEYAKQNPSASVREIAKASGASVGSAYNAKASVQNEHRAPPAPKPEPPPVIKPPQVQVDRIAEADTIVDTMLVPRLRQMNQHERVAFRRKTLMKMADECLDEDVVVF